MKAEHPEVRDLPQDGWGEALGKLLADRFASAGRALLCVTGKTGAGKTTFARGLRKAGLPGFKPSEIAVIDDGVLTAPLLGLINRRVRFPAGGRDDLAPFEPYLRRKKLVVYVAIDPAQRISRCDVLLRLRCGEGQRRHRLVTTRNNGAARYEKSLGKADDLNLAAGVCFDLSTD